MSSSRIHLFQGDARNCFGLGEQFYAIERSMGYTQANILWGTLALSKPALLPDGSSLYALDLPRPVHMAAGNFLSRTDGTTLSPGSYTGRITLHLSDARFAPVVKPAERWSSNGLVPFHNIDSFLAITTATPAAAKLACAVTLRLENLRYFASDAARDQGPTLEAQLLGTLTRCRDYLTSLLNQDPFHSDVRAPAASSSSALS